MFGTKVSLYNYGCPRPGDINFVTYANNLFVNGNLRAVYRGDPVTTVPGHVLGYRHVGTKVHFHNNTNFLVHPLYKDDMPNTHVGYISDHSAYRYISANFGLDG